MPFRTYGDIDVLSRWAGTRNLNGLPIRTVDRSVTISRSGRVNSRGESKIGCEVRNGSSIWNLRLPLELQWCGESGDGEGGERE